MGAWLHHQRLGFNYRMSELSAALGVTQMARLDQFIDRRAAVAAMYNERLRDLPWLRRPVVRPEVSMSWFVYVATLAEGLNRDSVMTEMQARGIPVRAYFEPIHLQPYTRDEHRPDPGSLPVTESLARRTVALPFHNRLTEAEVDTVVEALRAVASEFHAVD